MFFVLISFVNKISPIYLFISFFCLFSCQCVFAGSADGAVNDDDQNNLDERPRKQKRPLRSSIQLKGAGRTRHVLPEICIICRKDRYIVEAHTRKRKKEKLATCSTLDAKNLIQAAKDNSNTTLLLQIEDQDCVALEVRHHPCCYREYTRYLTKETQTETGKAHYQKYTEAREQARHLRHCQEMVRRSIHRYNKLATRVLLLTMSFTLSCLRFHSNSLYI